MTTSCLTKRGSLPKRCSHWIAATTHSISEEELAMSHLTNIKTQFKDRALLQAACKALGWAIHENARVRYYSGAAEMCEFIAEFGDAESYLSQTYNLGFQRQQDGTYRILCDNSMRGPIILQEGKIGGETVRILNSLKQQYACLKLDQTARQNGGRSVIEKQRDGSLVM